MQKRQGIKREREYGPGDLWKSFLDAMRPKCNLAFENDRLATIPAGWLSAYLKDADECRYGPRGSTIKREAAVFAILQTYKRPNIVGPFLFELLGDSEFRFSSVYELASVFTEYMEDPKWRMPDVVSLQHGRGTLKELYIMALATAVNMHGCAVTTHDEAIDKALEQKLSAWVSVNTEHSIHACYIDAHMFTVNWERVFSNRGTDMCAQNMKTCIDAVNVSTFMNAKKTSVAMLTYAQSMSITSYLDWEHYVQLRMLLYKLPCTFTMVPTTTTFHADKHYVVAAEMLPSFWVKALVAEAIEKQLVSRRSEFRRKIYMKSDIEEIDPKLFADVIIKDQATGINKPFDDLLHMFTTVDVLDCGYDNILIQEVALRSFGISYNIASVDMSKPKHLVVADMARFAAAERRMFLNEELELILQWVASHIDQIESMNYS